MSPGPLTPGIGHTITPRTCKAADSSDSTTTNSWSTIRGTTVCRRRGRKAHLISSLEIVSPPLRVISLLRTSLLICEVTGRTLPSQ